MTNDPRLIRAHIALFQGKPGETKRLVNDFVEAQSNPENARRHPLILWLEAQSFLRHKERVEALATLVENTPDDNTYHQIAHNFLEDERNYQTLLEAANTSEARQFMGLRLWIWGVMALMVLAIIITAVIVLASQPTEEPTVILESTEEATAEVTEEAATPTVTPTLTPTPYPQNTPLPIRERFQITVDYIPAGEIFISAIDRNIQFVLDAEGNPIEPMDGARFYGLAITFRCQQALCHNIPEADLSLVLENAFLGPIPALQNVTIPNVELGMLQGAIAIGPEVTGWVVFEVPLREEPAILRVAPFPVLTDGTLVPQPTKDSEFPTIEGEE